MLYTFRRCRCRHIYTMICEIVFWSPNLVHVHNKTHIDNHMSICERIPFNRYNWILNNQATSTLHLTCDSFLFFFIFLVRSPVPRKVAPVVFWVGGNTSIFPVFHHRMNLSFILSNHMSHHSVPLHAWPEPSHLALFLSSIACKFWMLILISHENLGIPIYMKKCKQKHFGYGHQPDPQIHLTEVLLLHYRWNDLME